MMPSTAVPSGFIRKTRLSRHSNSESAPICALGNHHQFPPTQTISSMGGYAIVSVSKTQSGGYADSAVNPNRSAI